MNIFLLAFIMSLFVLFGAFIFDGAFMEATFIDGPAGTILSYFFMAIMYTFFGDK